MPYSSFYNYVCYTVRTIVKSTYWTTTENGSKRPKVQKQPQPFKVYPIKSGILNWMYFS